MTREEAIEVLENRNTEMKEDLKVIKAMTNAEFEEHFEEFPELVCYDCRKRIRKPSCEHCSTSRFFFAAVQ